MSARAHDVSQILLSHHKDYWKGCFFAMGSPCEVLIHRATDQEAGRLVHALAEEAWRIERKFSRYRRKNQVARINSGRSVQVDEETARLIDFGAHLYHSSEGAFDLTSGVLRRIWRFTPDGMGDLPTTQQLSDIRPYIGWDKVQWSAPWITLPLGMQIDFGGIGKEYAVDRAAAIAREQHAQSTLVNFGGDLAVSRPRDDGNPWQVGIEAIGLPTGGADRLLHLHSGALATSGDSRRYVIIDGWRYGHVLDPRTASPVDNAPGSVTVAANTCAEAGSLATLAMLQGDGAERFLSTHANRHWVSR